MMYNNKMKLVKSKSGMMKIVKNSLRDYIQYAKDTFKLGQELNKCSELEIQYFVILDNKGIEHHLDFDTTKQESKDIKLTKIIYLFSAGEDGFIDTEIGNLNYMINDDGSQFDYMKNKIKELKSELN